MEENNLPYPQSIIKETEDFFKIYHGEKNVLIDIGAHVGLYSAIALNNGFKKIYAYEPINENYMQLVNNINKTNIFQRVIANNQAVVRKYQPGLKFKMFPGNAGQSGEFFKESRIEQEVNQIRFCDLISSVENEIGKDIDLLKIDIEGGEYDLLRPSEILEFLLRDVKAIHVCFHPLDNGYFDIDNQKLKGASKENIEKFLYEIGFTKSDKHEEYYYR